MTFRDREEAGHRLAAKLEAHRSERPLVLALPPAGVPVAFEVARALGARLDVLLVRALRAGSPERTMAGARPRSAREPAHGVGLNDVDLVAIRARQSPELVERVREHRREHAAERLSAQTVILVDDGVVSGATARAAARAARRRGAAKLILAVPVIGRRCELALRGEVDEIVALERPAEVASVGDWYERYEAVSADDALAYLRRAPAARAPAAAETDLWDGEWIGGDIADPPSGPSIHGGPEVHAMKFIDRADAGRRLAKLLERYRDEDPVVLALPRGGVPVGYEVARQLGAPLDVLIVRKLGAPQCPEYAIGAIAEGGAVFIEPIAVLEADVGEAELAEVAEREAVEVARRAQLYRSGRPLPALQNRTALLVDDGIATGRTARAAIRAVRELGPRRVVLAAPTVAAATAPILRGEVDDLVYLDAPQEFVAVGIWYEHFTQVTDDEVMALLARARGVLPAAPPRGAGQRGAADERIEPSVREQREVAIPVHGGEIHADVVVPAKARGVVLFAHGSGSSRFSRRNRHVAHKLQEAELATVLLDLLTHEEGLEDEISGRLRFDIELLGERLVAATRFARRDPRLRRLPVGYFGASTGAAAALIAAAELPGDVAAVVSRGGRPDLAPLEALRRVVAPTLLIVGGEDRMVLDLNAAALEQLSAEKKLAVVPGATHLFEEPGKLDAVADLAAAWFNGHLGPARRASAPAPASAVR